ncbi:MAG TPA: hypothetical protein VGO52_08870 [Hyphomonadaceae bacterium]|jgi:hypothetical protein|nr:hypothetical protein [Hyphomonadaceae bacterium]
MNVSPANTRLAIIGLALIACAACASTQPDTVSWPAWAEKGPMFRDYMAVYPARAKRLGLESSVRLICTIDTNRRLDCTPDWEQHPGAGFGEAAVVVSKRFVLKKTGEPELQPGKIVIVPMAFRLED